MRHVLVCWPVLATLIATFVHAASTNVVGRPLPVPPIRIGSDERTEGPRIDGYILGAFAPSVSPRKQAGRFRMPEEWSGAGVWALHFAAEGTPPRHHKKGLRPPEEGTLLLAWTPKGLCVGLVLVAPARPGAFVRLSLCDDPGGPQGSPTDPGGYSLRCWLGNRRNEEGGFDGHKWISNRNLYFGSGSKGYRLPKAAFGRAVMRAQLPVEPSREVSRPPAARAVTYQVEAFLPTLDEEASYAHPDATRSWAAPLPLAHFAEDGRLVYLGVEFCPWEGESVRLVGQGGERWIPLRLPNGGAPPELSAPVVAALPRVEDPPEDVGTWRKALASAAPLRLVSATGEKIEADLYSCDDGLGNAVGKMRVYGNGHLAFALELRGVAARAGDTADLAMESGHSTKPDSPPDAVLEPGGEALVRVRCGSPSTFETYAASLRGWQRSRIADASGSAAVFPAAPGSALISRTVFAWKVPYGFNSSAGLRIFDRQAAQLSLRYVRADGAVFTPVGWGSVDGVTLVPDAPPAALGWARVETQAPPVAFRFPEEGAPIGDGTDVLLLARAFGTTGKGSASNEVRSLRLLCAPENVSGPVRPDPIEAAAQFVGSGDLWRAHVTLPRDAGTWLLTAIATDSNGNRTRVDRRVGDSLAVDGVHVSMERTDLELKGKVIGVTPASIRRAWFTLDGDRQEPASVSSDGAGASLQARWDPRQNPDVAVLSAEIELSDGRVALSDPQILSSKREPANR